MGKAVLVIGAGVAGINCALSIADYGIQVYLVDNTPSIGGMMARLDKTFPTNDCSICIEAPQMFDVNNHKNIEILTNTEIKKVEKDGGKFTVRILKKAMFVDEEACTACGACVESCPVSVSDTLDGRIGGVRKLVSMAFPQAVPNIVSIDSTCRYGDMISEGACIGGCVVDCSQCRECSIALCRKACEKEGKNAILLWQFNKQITLEVTSIVIATGIKSALPVGDFLGYGVVDNVVTNLEFERLMNAGGPTAGRIVRPSDGKLVKKIGWVQCVGRGIRFETGLKYCSGVCCMIACKQAIVAIEHDSSISANIYYTDLKVYGKNFWNFYKKSLSNHVNWFHGRPYYVVEDLDNGNVLVRYEDLDKGLIVNDELDLLVLSTGIAPSTHNARLAKILKVELDDDGFFLEKRDLMFSLETNVEGIYLCGGSTGPIDISESVSQSYAAAMKAVIASF